MKSVFLWALLAVLICVALARYLGRGRRSGGQTNHVIKESFSPLVKKRTILVLDLDETLVSAQTTGEFEVHLRPHVIEFLDIMASTFDEVVAFTAGTVAYAEPVLDALRDSVIRHANRATQGQAARLFKRRFYRESCDFVPGVGVIKDLRLVTMNMASVLLVDNTPSTYARQPENGVPIASWYGSDQNDTALMDLVPVLQEAAASGDMRSAVRRMRTS